MESLLEPVKSRKIQSEPLITPLTTPAANRDLNLKSFKDVQELLKNQPDIQSLQAAIEYLLQNHEVDIKVPSSRITPIIQTLVSDVIPNYWQQLLDDETLGDLLKAVVDCLRSLPALGAIISRIKALIVATDTDGGVGKRSFIESQIVCLIQLLEKVCIGNSLISIIWEHNITSTASNLQKSLCWKEFVSLLCGGKIIAVVSEAEVKLDSTVSLSPKSWLANGTEYSRWLARNIECLSGHEKRKSLEESSQLLGRSLGIGYAGG
jgi:telomere length regulation protein